MLLNWTHHALRRSPGIVQGIGWRQHAWTSSTSVMAPRHFQWRPEAFGKASLLTPPIMTLFHDPMFSIQRVFSSRRRTQGVSKDSGLLANENLIKEIMSRHGSSSSSTPDTVQVRLVIDEGPGKPARVETVSLADAISISVERMTDLIGTEVEKNPPVIRATPLSKIEYKKEQAAKKNFSQGKQKKNFRFTAGIGDHDFERKVADMIKSLKQGLECEFTVFSKRNLLNQNASVGMDLVKRIQELVGDLAELKKSPEVNEAGNNIRVVLERAKKE